MSQNSIVLPTTGTVSGLAMAQATNNALDTLNTFASGPSAPTSPEAGQLWHDTTNKLLKILSMDASTWIPLFSFDETDYTGAPIASGPLGQCQLGFTSTTSLTLLPNQGNKVSFPSGAVATVPAGGIVSNITSCYLNGTAASALSVSTVYYAYLWNAGTSGSPSYVIDWSATAYTTDSTSGISVKNGDATRVLVGAAFVTPSGTLANSNVQRYVRSWFHDQGVTLSSSYGAGQSTSSTSPVEINSNIRCSFLKWARDNVQVSFTGDAEKNTTNGSVVTFLNFDAGGTNVGPSTGQSTVTNAVFPVACADSYQGGQLAEGAHFVTVFGANNNAGTAIWDGGCTLTGKVGL